MRKDYISAFLCFASFVIRFIPIPETGTKLLRQNCFAKFCENMRKLIKHTIDLVLFLIFCIYRIFETKTFPIPKPVLNYCAKIGSKICKIIVSTRFLIEYLTMITEHIALHLKHKTLKGL